VARRNRRRRHDSTQRADLARWLAHAIAERLSLEGLSDHFVSEAAYLRDPDGHGIEIYADRPRALWEGQVSHMTRRACRCS
jgi:catechol 2,3-dioxygenase